MANELLVVNVRLSRLLRAKQTSGVRLPQISALAALALNGPMTPGALAQYERVRPPSMTRVLGLLESAGLVERTKHPTDGRQSIVVLAKAGESLLEQEGAAREEWLCSRIRQLSAGEQDTLRAAVKILMDMANE